MTTRIQLRRDTAANWTSSNPVLGQGEPGLEEDTGRLKFGDGVTAWRALHYAAVESTMDGGSATSVYLASQGIDGGSA